MNLSNRILYNIVTSIKSFQMTGKNQTLPEGSIYLKADEGRKYNMGAMQAVFKADEYLERFWKCNYCRLNYKF